MNLVLVLINSQYSLKKVLFSRHLQVIYYCGTTVNTCCRRGPPELLFSSNISTCPSTIITRAPGAGTRTLDFTAWADTSVSSAVLIPSLSAPCVTRNPNTSTTSCCTWRPTSNDPLVYACIRLIPFWGGFKQIIVFLI